MFAHIQAQYPDQQFHRDTTTASPPSIPLLRQALFHKFVVKNGRRFTAAEMNPSSRNALVAARVSPTNTLIWVGEIMNILTVDQKFGRESVVQIRWLKPLQYVIDDASSI